MDLCAYLASITSSKLLCDNSKLLNIISSESSSEALHDFIHNPDTRLYISESSITTNPPPPTSSYVCFSKTSQSLNLSSPLDSQLEASLLDLSELKSLLSQSSLYNLSPQLKHQISTLYHSIQCQLHPSSVPPISLPPLPKDFEPVLEQVVEGWIAELNRIRQIDKDLANSNCSEEIQFWNELCQKLEDLISENEPSYSVLIHRLNSNLFLKGQLEEAWLKNHLLKLKSWCRFLNSLKFEKIEEFISLNDILEYIETFSRILNSSSVFKFHKSRVIKFIRVFIVDVFNICFDINPSYRSPFCLSFAEFEQFKDFVISFVKQFNVILSNIETVYLSDENGKYLIESIAREIKSVKERVLQLHSVYCQYNCLIKLVCKKEFVENQTKQEDYRRLLKDSFYNLSRSFSFEFSSLNFNTTLSAIESFNKGIEMIHSDIIDSIHQILDNSESISTTFNVLGQISPLFSNNSVRKALRKHNLKLDNQLRDELDQLTKFLTKMDNTLKLYHSPQFKKNPFPESTQNLYENKGNCYLNVLFQHMKALRKRVEGFTDQLILIFGESFKHHIDFCGYRNNLLNFTKSLSFFEKEMIKFVLGRLKKLCHNGYISTLPPLQLCSKNRNTLITLESPFSLSDFLLISNVDLLNHVYHTEVVSETPVLKAFLDDILNCFSFPNIQNPINVINQLQNSLKVSETAFSIIKTAKDSDYVLHYCRNEIARFRKYAKYFTNDQNCTNNTQVTLLNLQRSNVLKFSQLCLGLYNKACDGLGKINSAELAICQLEHLLKQNCSWEQFKGKLTSLINEIRLSSGNVDNSITNSPSDVLCSLAGSLDSTCKELLTRVLSSFLEPSENFKILEHFTLRPIKTRLIFTQNRAKFSLLLEHSISQLSSGLFNHLNFIYSEFELLPKVSAKSISHLLECEAIRNVIESLHDCVSQLDAKLRSFFNHVDIINTLCTVKIDEETQNLDLIIDYLGLISRCSQVGDFLQTKHEVVLCFPFEVNVDDVSSQIEFHFSELFQQKASSFSTIIYNFGHLAIKLCTNIKDSLQGSFENDLSCLIWILNHRETFEQLKQSASVYASLLSSSLSIPLDSSVDAEYLLSVLSTTDHLLNQKLEQINNINNTKKLRGIILDESEKFVQSINQKLQQWKNSKPCKPNTLPSESLKVVSRFQDFCTESFTRHAKLSKAICHLKEVNTGLNFEPAKSNLSRAFKILNIIDSETSEYQRLWEHLSHSSDKLNILLSDPFSTLFHPSCLSILKENLSDLYDSLRSISISVECHNYYLQLVSNCLSLVPLISDIVSTNLKQRHRYKLFKLFGLDKFHSLQEIPLTYIFGVCGSLNLKSFESEIRSLLTIAEGESSVEEFLSCTEAFWNNELLTFTQPSNSEYLLVTNLDSLSQKVFDDLSAVDSVKKSPYFEPFEPQALKLENLLLSLENRLTLLSKVQSLFVEVSSISKLYSFNTTTFGKKWTDSCFTFGKLTSKLADSLNVISIVNNPKYSELLDDVMEGLQFVQQQLLSVLENERAKFPRLYFIGDSELFSMLSSFKNNISELAPFLPKIFTGIGTLVIDNSKVTDVCCPLGDSLTLSDPLDTSLYDSLPEFLSGLCNSVTMSLRKSLSVMLKALTTDLLNNSAQLESVLTDFLANKPFQLIWLSFLVFWTRETENCLANNTNIQPLGNFFKEVLSTLSSFIRSEVRLVSVKSKALLPEFVKLHLVLEKLNLNPKISKSSYKWLSNLRAYQANSVNQPITISVGHSSQEYGWEFIGIRDFLVRTPLLQDSFNIFMHALANGLSSAPTGPAGTGKTESIRALGAFLGRQVLVFNADKSFDSRSMTRIFVGLCESGAWGCFDEFNRLSPEVLSFVSNEIFEIQKSIKNSDRSAKLSFRTADLHKFTALFVTMNPLSSNYKGRNELPENLKTLFRPVSMEKPDLEDISRVLLLSQGFSPEFVENYSSKIVELFRLCKSEMSDQHHYDFGLRAIKKSILLCGSLLNSSSVTSHFELLVSSIQQTVRPKLLGKDLDLLKELVTTIFGDVGSYLVDDNQLQELQRLITSSYPSVTSIWKQKMLDFVSLIPSYHGLLLSGVSSSGKSSVIMIGSKLFNAEVVYFDPSSLGKRSFYGYKDPATGEWFDGVFTSKLRGIATSCSQSNSNIWIVLDSDLDPDWVELLNSLLDDNKCLSLPTGERIPLLSNTRIILETFDTKSASLATVSRCGTIYFPNNSIEFKCLVLDLLGDLGKNELFVDILSCFILSNNFITHCFNILKDFVPQFADCFFGNYSENSILYNIASTFSSVLLSNFNNDDVSNGIHSAKFIQRFSFISFLKALTSSFHRDMAIEISDSICTFNLISDLLPLPNSDDSSLLDFIVLPSSDYQLIEVETQTINSINLMEKEPFVLTQDTAYFVDLLKNLYYANKSALLYGPPGYGKSFLISFVFDSLPNTNMVTLSFSGETTVTFIEKTLSSCCEAVSVGNSTILRPKSAKKLVLFCDEINLPKLSTYGHSPTSMFLRQLIELKRVYLFDKYCLISDDIYIVAACNPSSDPGRIVLPERLFRHLTPIYISTPSNSSLFTIYNSILGLVAQNFKAIQPFLDPVTRFIIGVFSECKSTFSNSNLLYVYSLRDLSRLMRGIYIGLTSLDDGGFSVEAFISVVLSELLNNFGTRLTNQDDYSSFIRTVTSLFEQHLPKFKNSEQIETILSNTTVFTSLLGTDLEFVEKSVLAHSLSLKTEDFYKKFNKVLVPIPSFIDSLIKLDSILRQPLGHCIIVGESGSSKTSLIEFISFIKSIPVHFLHIIENYSLNSFLSDIKSVVRMAGVDNRQVLLSIDDFLISNNSIVESLNCLLSQGDTPGLFEGDSLETLLSEVKATLSSNEKGDLYSIFTSRVRNNLHICYSITNTESPNLSPALINRCSVLFMAHWEFSGVFSLTSSLFQANSRFSDFQLVISTLEVDDSLEFISSLVSTIFDKIQSFCQSNDLHLSPINSLFSLINLIISSGLQIYKESSTQIERVSQGIGMLEKSVVAIDSLSADLSRQEQILAEKQAQAKVSLKNLVDKQKDLESQKTSLETMTIELEKAQNQVKINQEAAQTRLSEVEPAVIEAQKALQEIKRVHLNELQSLSSPPDGVVLTLHAISIALGIISERNPDWNRIRSVIRSPDFISRIMSFEGSQLTEKQRLKLQRDFLENPLFTFENVKNSSKVCALLFKWLVSQLNYANIQSEIAPLKAECTELEKQAALLIDQKSEAEVKISQLSAEITGLDETYQTQMAEAAEINTHLENVKGKSGRAITLLQSFDSERSRWNSYTKDQKQMAGRVVSQSVLIGFMIATCGIFDVRQKQLIKDQICSSLVEDFNLTLVDPCSAILNSKEIKIFDSLDCSLSNHLSGTKQLFEKFCGSNLVSLDEFSVLFNILSIIDPSNIVPLVIDPSHRIFDVLSSIYDEIFAVTVVTVGSNGWLKNLENAMRFGHFVFINFSDVQVFDPILVSLLDKGSSSSLQFNGKLIDVSPSFNFALLSDQHLSNIPEILVKRCRLISFELTFSTVSNIFLQDLLKNIYPSLFETKVNLLSEIELNKPKLVKLEDELLLKLSQSTQSILEDQELLITLENLKKESTLINQKVAESLSAINQIESRSSDLLYVSQRVTCCYFALQKLAGINNLYSITYSDYYRIINSCLLNWKRDQSSEHCFDISKLLRSLLSQIFVSLSSSLKRSDRSLLLLMILTSLFPAEFKSFTKNDNETLIDSEISLIGKELAKILSESPENFVNFLISSVSNLEHVILTPDKSNISDPFAVNPSMILTSCYSKPLLLMSSPRYNTVDLVRSHHPNAVTLTVGEMDLDSAKRTIQSSRRSKVPMVVVNVHIDSVNVASLLDKFTNDCSIILLSEIKSLPSNLLMMCHHVILDDYEGLVPLLKSTFSFAKTVVDNSALAQVDGVASICLLCCLFFSIVAEYSRFVPFGLTKPITLKFSDLSYMLNICFDFIGTDLTTVNFDAIDWNGLADTVPKLGVLGQVTSQRDCQCVLDIAKKVFSRQKCRFGGKLLPNALVLPPSNDWETLLDWIDNQTRVDLSNIWLKDHYLEELEKSKVETLINSLNEIV
ncbi:hypothetical protein P9112_011483 [Eukaryota sp. TZLM1-RC]